MSYDYVDTLVQPQPRHHIPAPTQLERTARRPISGQPVLNGKPPGVHTYLVCRAKFRLSEPTMERACPQPLAVFAQRRAD